MEDRYYFAVPYNKGDMGMLDTAQQLLIADAEAEGASEKSIELYGRLLKEDAKNEAIWYNLRGIEKACLKDFGGAETDFLSVLALQPTNKVGYYNLGQLYLEQNDFEKAQVSFKQAKNIDREDADIHYQLGITAMRQKHFSEAIKSFDAALELSPEYVPAIFSRGLAKEQLTEKTVKRRRGFQFKKEHFASAIEDYKKVLELEPGFLASLVGLARVNEKLGEYSLAHQYVSNILENYPKSFEMMVWRARIRIELLEFQGVIEDCSHAIAIDQTCATAYLYRKKAHEALGNSAEALEDQSMISKLIVRKAK